jgi:uncharacterized protein
MSRNNNGFVTVLVEFERALRSKGLAVGSGDILTYCAAITSLDPTDLVDLHWAGRTTKRRTSRTKTARGGRKPDMRRTIRESMRTHGEMVDLYWRRRRVRLRPLILILDVSGSISDYSRALLQFSYSAKRASQKVDVFCFGTQLTQVTKPLHTRKPDEALERATKLVVDWEGGTRIGDSIDHFVRKWARRGMCRGGVVVICSDGLDRGDPELLSHSMDRLSRLCHNIVWMNPHKGNNADYKPQTVGMMAAEPPIDVLLSGHDLSSLEERATLLPKLD